MKNITRFGIEQDAYFKKILEENNTVILAVAELRSYGIDKNFKSFTGFPIAYHEKNIEIIILYSDTIVTSNGI